MEFKTTFPPFELVVLKWWTAENRQGLSHLIVQLLPTHERKKHVSSGEIPELIRQQQGHGDQKRDKNPTSRQTHLENIFHFYSAPAHFHPQSGFIVVVSDIFDIYISFNYKLRFLLLFTFFVK